MSERIHIVQIGKDEALAAILAEQAGQAGGTSEKRSFDFEFTAVADISAAPSSADVWVLAGNTPSPVDSDTAPLCIRIADKTDAGTRGDETVFEKPLRLAQFLDTTLSSARLRRKKQPRALNATHEFHPFARKVLESTSGRSVLLTEKEASLLCAVLDAGAEGLQRKDAMTELWGYHPDVDSHAVDTTLYRLRQKLQELSDIDHALINEGGLYKWRI